MSISKKTFKGITNKTRELLKKPESKDVEFKRSVSGIETKDLVAFANSPIGGIILIGIDEKKDLNNLQSGQIIGCSVGDKECLQIENKAQDCYPPIEINIFIENTNKTPFFRIEIPSGKFKPYCTKSGTYTIRGNSRTNPLTPDHLLKIFIEREADSFLSRFRNATSDINNSLKEIESEVTSGTAKVAKNVNVLNLTMDRKLSDIYKNVSNMDWKIAEKLESAFDSTMEVLSATEDSMDSSYETLNSTVYILEKINEIDSVTYRNNQIIEQIMKKFNIEDPYRTNARENLRIRIYSLHNDNKEINTAEISKEFIKDYHFPGINYKLVLSWANEIKEQLHNRKKTSPKPDKGNGQDQTAL